MTRKLALIICFPIMILSSVQAQRNDFWEINFYKADSIAEVYASRDLKNPEKLAEDLTKDLTTEVEKFRVIFRWVTDNIRYDLDLYLEQDIKERKLRYKKKNLLSWRRRFSNKVERRLFQKKMSICDGYARLLERMSEHVGISCVKIVGYGRGDESTIGKGTINHAWNGVKLNNKWYLCDATWASSKLDKATMRFHRRFDKNYFLTDPSLFIANHFPADTSWTLVHDKPTLKQFLNAPIKSGAYIANRVNTYSPAAGILRIKKCESVSFEFTCNTDLRKTHAQVQLCVERDKQKEELKTRIRRNSDGVYSIPYTFENSGGYKVDVEVNGQSILTYRVYVK